jgi:hypothetical protein
MVRRIVGTQMSSLYSSSPAIRFPSLRRESFSDKRTEVRNVIVRRPETTPERSCKLPRISSSHSSAQRLASSAKSD